MKHNQKGFINIPSSPRVFVGDIGRFFIPRTTTLRGDERGVKGFTLIELLVVVLIIGILAAVALPQYRISVAKTRAVQLQARVDALRKAAEVYLMANGVWPNDVRLLDIDITQDAAEFKQSDITPVDHIGVFYTNGDFCGVWQSSVGNRTIYCNNSDIYLHFLQNKEPHLRCIALTDLGTKVCNTMVL